jgi:hypothetical protein
MRIFWASASCPCFEAKALRRRHLVQNGAIASCCPAALMIGPYLADSFQTANTFLGCLVAQGKQICKSLQNSFIGTWTPLFKAWPAKARWSVGFFSFSFSVLLPCSVLLIFFVFLFYWLFPILKLRKLRKLKINKLRKRTIHKLRKRTIPKSVLVLWYTRPLTDHPEKHILWHCLRQVYWLVRQVQMFGIPDTTRRTSSCVCLHDSSCMNKKSVVSEVNFQLASNVG